MAKRPTRVWGPHDDVLIYTCDLLDIIQHQRWESLPQLASHFRPQVEGERLLLDRPFARREWRALGDGTYYRSSGGFFATGRGALPLMLGFAAGQAIANSNARRQAAAAAQPRWAYADAGHLFVATHGFYMQTGRGLYRWGWDAIDGASVEAPGVVQVQGRSVNGPVHWQLETHAAELVFVLWTLARHQDHPQLVTDTWLPRGWVAWAAHQQGRMPRAVRVPPPALGDG